MDKSKETIYNNGILPKTDKIIGSILLLGNGLSIIFGILIFFGLNLSWGSNFWGGWIFITFMLNSIINHLVYLFRVYSDIDYDEYLEITIIYDIITFFAALFLGFGNLQQSFAFHVQASFMGNMGLFLRILGYFIPFLFEIYIIRRSVFRRTKFLPFNTRNDDKDEIDVKDDSGEIKNKRKKEFSLKSTRLNKFLEKRKTRRIINNLIKFICVMVSLYGIFLIVIMYGVSPHPIDMEKVLNISGGIMGIIIAPFAIFFGMAAFTNGVLAFKLNHKYKLRKNFKPILAKGYLLVGFISITISLMFFNSLFLMPSTISDAKIEFESVFGEEWALAQQRYDFENAQKYFLDEPTKFSEYFLPTFSDNCHIIQDVLFYNDSIGLDDNITLFYDVYMPGEGSEKMPGQNSTVIRIHGGAWMFGDKGVANMIQMSKYLASQGYVVFDIQYGLYNVSLNDNISNIFKNMPQDPKRIGNFTLDDMIRHIGLFTYHLEENFQKYGANLDSVFISGGSAGGHLCCAATLAMFDPEYEHLFSNEINVRGFIPIYPANDICRIDGVDSSEDFIDPKRMVTSDSIPSIIFQGKNDGLVHPQLAQDFKDSYLENSNNNCAVIYLKLAAHAFDVYYSGYYNQLLLYYTERFLYIFR